MVSLRLVAGSDGAVGASIALCCFLAYTGVYMIRMPLFVPTYDGTSVWGMDFKVALAFAMVRACTIAVKKVTLTSARRRWDTGLGRYQRSCLFHVWSYCRMGMLVK